MGLAAALLLVTPAAFASVTTTVLNPTVSFGPVSPVTTFDFNPVTGATATNGSLPFSFTFFDNALYFRSRASATPDANSFYRTRLIHSITTFEGFLSTPGETVSASAPSGFVWIETPSTTQEVEFTTANGLLLNDTIQYFAFAFQQTSTDDVQYGYFALSTLDDPSSTGATLTLHGYAYETGVGSLIVSAIPAAIPEPSAVGLLVGLGALGFAATRRRRRVL